MPKLADVLHAHFLWLLLGTYAVAAACPGPGVSIRGISAGRVHVLGETLELSTPLLTLAALLFNAGLGVRAGQFRSLVRSPGPLFAGLAANLAVPVLYLLAVSMATAPWGNPDRVQTILVGLALVAAMPIAGASTAWSQNAEGDLALSLALVLGSTILSPLTTPVILHVAGSLTNGERSRDLHALAAGGEAFLAAGVILPTFAGILVRTLAGERRAAAAKPLLKASNILMLLFLNYSNSAISLPQAVAEPDANFLVAALAIVVGLCALMFATGWAVARSLRQGRDRRVAMMFGLGMSNNGTGMVLASMSMSAHPRVLLPIIFYTLTQHLMAGTVDRLTPQGEPIITPLAEPPALPGTTAAATPCASRS